jgi:hypothetical protein
MFQVDGKVALITGATTAALRQSKRNCLAYADGGWTTWQEEADC